MKGIGSSRNREIAIIKWQKKGKIGIIDWIMENYFITNMFNITNHVETHHIIRIQFDEN